MFGAESRGWSAGGLLVQDVRSVTTQFAGGEGFGKGLGFHQFSPGAVQDDGSLFHASDAVGPDQPRVSSERKQCREMTSACSRTSFMVWQVLN